MFDYQSLLSSRTSKYLSEQGGSRNERRFES